MIEMLTLDVLNKFWHLNKAVFMGFSGGEGLHQIALSWDVNWKWENGGNVYVNCILEKLWENQGGIEGGS